METFLTWFTWDLIIYSLASIWHSFFIILMGFAGAFLIMNKIKTLEASNGVDVTIEYGFRCALFGTILGSVNYLSGSIV